MVWMWALDHKEGWEPKKWCFWTEVLEKTLESPLACKVIQPVHPKGDQPWMFIGKTDVEIENPTLWPPDGKSWLIWKDPDVGKGWGQEEKGTTEDEMVGWHHWLPQWTWVWVNSRSWWWTGRPGMLRFMGSQRVKHYWVTELNWTEQQCPQNWKRSLFIPIPMKGNAKECSNYHTISIISHASKIMLKTLQTRLQ